MKKISCIILFNIIIFINSDLVTAQIIQYESYKKIVESSFGEPDTLYTQTNIILDLDRNQISVISDNDTIIHDILIEMEDDRTDYYFKTFQVGDRNENDDEHSRFHFVGSRKDSEPEICIFEYRKLGGVNVYYVLE